MKTTKRISLALAMLFSVLSFGQTMSLSGTVTDEAGLPIPGANVIVKGTKQKTSTDLYGAYKIQAKKADQLVFSYIGYITGYVTVAKSTTINFQMQPETQSLKEVVVVGYGNSVKRMDYTALWLAFRVRI